MGDECRSLDGRREHCGCYPTCARCHWCGKDLREGNGAHPDTMIGRR